MIIRYSFSNSATRVEHLAIGMVVAAYLQYRDYTIPVKILGMYRTENGMSVITDSVPISKMQENEYYLVEDLEDGRKFKLEAKYVGRNRKRLVWGYSPVSFREIYCMEERD